MAAAPAARWQRLLAVLLLLALPAMPEAAASGPRWVAGSSYFDPAAKGQAVRWPGGVVTYLTDNGDLSPLEPIGTANVLVLNGALAWNKVSTAGVQIVRRTRLKEDVNGSNVYVGANGLVMPADIQPSATDAPVAVVYDQDGAVLDAMFGKGASNPAACRDNGVYVQIDNVAPSGAILHALMILNGRCAQDEAHIALMQYLLVRAWGRILGLDWSNANESMFSDGTIDAAGLAGWPILHPFERLCPIQATNCMPSAPTLRPDDIASVSRMYPVTTENQAANPTKKLTAENTISIQGTIRFRGGQGMQGVGVVAQPLDAKTGLPDARATVSAVSGASFQGNQGNVVTGPNDFSGNPLNRYGSDDPELEGHFDLSAIPLPAGKTQADYRIALVALDRLDTGNASVGAYTMSQVTPSGTLPSVIVRGLAAGTVLEQDFTLADSAWDDHGGGDGTAARAALLSGSGEWLGRISGYGHAGFFQFPVKANRAFTVEAQALDDYGAPTLMKLRPMLGLWNASDATGDLPAVGMLLPFNGAAKGLSTLQGTTVAAGQVLLGIDDQRGDGRPDYRYRGRVLYADTVTPSHVPLQGGAICIRGMGFRANSVVTVNGMAAVVSSVAPNEIRAIAPAAGSGVSGLVDVAISDPATLAITVLGQVLSYDAGPNDGLTIVSAPAANAAMGVPQSFTVKVLSGDTGEAVASVSVTFALQTGTATLACGLSACSTTTSVDGLASVSVTPSNTSAVVVSAALRNGASVRVSFTGTSAPQIAALTPVLYLAHDVAFSWSPQALVLNRGAPVANVPVTWSANPGAITPPVSVLSSKSGIATGQVTAGPLSGDASIPVRACLAGDVNCATFLIVPIHAETAEIVAVAGVGQSLALAQSPAPVVLRITDAVGHPLAGATLHVAQTLRVWTPPCKANGRCAPGSVLSSASLNLVSNADGLVGFAPLSRGDLATRLAVIVTTGNSAQIRFEIERQR